MVIAGSDTTSTSLCGTFFYLSRNRRVYAKLTREIRSVFSSAEEIVLGPKLAGREYLQAVIDEGMRLSPHDVSELPHEVLLGGLTINGAFIPAGTIVGSAG